MPMGRRAPPFPIGFFKSGPNFPSIAAGLGPNQLTAQRPFSKLKTPYYVGVERGAGITLPRSARAPRFQKLGEVTTMSRIIEFGDDELMFIPANPPVVPYQYDPRPGDRTVVADPKSLA